MIVEKPDFQESPKTADRIDLTYEGIATNPCFLDARTVHIIDRIDLTYEGIATRHAYDRNTDNPYLTELT